MKKFPLNSTRGFSLVEIALAIGLLAFGMVSIIGLLPVGLTTFREAMERTISTQIVQAVVNEYQLTDFEEIPATTQILYFDDEGQSNDYSGRPVDASTAKYRAEVETFASPILPGGQDNPDMRGLAVRIIDQPSGLSLRTFSSLLVKRTK